jgi:hypothetical protein
MVPLLLGAEGPDGARNQSSLVLWLLMRFLHTRVWPLDGCTEAIAAAFVLLLLIDDILVVVGVPEAVLIAMIVFMDVTLIRVATPL